MILEWDILYYLKSILKHFLKIDREYKGFTKSHFQPNRKRCELSNDLKLNLVAEGIENKEQLNCLREMNCKFGQGYLYSRPIMVKELETILKMGMCLPAV